MIPIGSGLARLSGDERGGTPMVRRPMIIRMQRHIDGAIRKKWQAKRFLRLVSSNQPGAFDVPGC